MKNEVQSLRKILYNPILLEKFKDFDENKNDFDYPDKESYVIRLQKVIIDEINKMTSETYDIELITSWFRCILQDYYFEDIYLLYHNEVYNALIKKTREVNGDITMYTDYLTSCLNDIEYSEKYLDCLDRYLNYKNSSYIIDSEFERYVFALNMKKDIPEEDLEFVFNKILDRGYKVSDEEYQKIFGKFSLFAAKQFGLKNTKINITTRKRIYETVYKKKDDGKKIIAVHRTETEIEGKQRTIHNILFNIEEIKSEKAVENIECLFHEIKHGVQYEEIGELYRMDVLKQVEDSMLRYLLGEEYYNRNYRYISVETDAVVCSKILLTHFLKKFAPNTYRLRKQDLDSLLSVSIKEEMVDKRRVSYTELQDVQLLFSKVISENPEILTSNNIEEPVLQVILQVYNQDGTPKTPDIYFKQKELLLEEMNKLTIDQIDELTEIKRKIDFYDAALTNLKYNRIDLERNYAALDQFESKNQDINSEVFQYKTKLELILGKNVETKASLKK